MKLNKLRELGLTDAEAKIYYAVLKLKNCTVKDISKESGFHRTNIYDILDKLKEKGLITFVKEGKVARYAVADPDNFYDLLKEKKEILDSIYPDLHKLYQSSSEEIQVEVYKGVEGMKSAWRDQLKVRKPIYGYGVKGQLREKLPVFAKQWLRDAKKKKIPYYGIYTERGNTPTYFTKIKYVSKELSGPVATFIYGDNVNINIWDPHLIAIIIKSKLVATMFKNHFNLLWKVAKK